MPVKQVPVDFSQFLFCENEYWGYLWKKKFVKQCFFKYGIKQIINPVFALLNILIWMAISKNDVSIEHNGESIIV